MQWHQLNHMQTICTLLQTDNNINTPSLDFLQAGCSSWRPMNSVKAHNAHNGQQKSNLRHKKREVKVTMEGIRTGTGTERCPTTVPTVLSKPHSLTIKFLDLFQFSLTGRNQVPHQYMRHSFIYRLQTSHLNKAVHTCKKYRWNETMLQYHSAFYFIFASPHM